MSYPDEFRRTPGSVGSLEDAIPGDLQGSTTTGYSALNNPQNTQTVGGGDAGVGAQYPHSRTNVSRSGHVLQFNDTPAGERVLLKHRTGSAVDMLPDGSMAISSNGNLVLTVMKDQTIVIHGSVKYEVNGDFDFDVRGNFNVKALNYNLDVEGNQTETVRGSARSTVSGNKGTTVKGSSSLTTLGSITQTSLGNTSVISKGTLMSTSGSNMTIASGGAMKTSASGGYDVSSTNINIAANSTTVVGATGTFGGEGVHVYAKNARVQKTVYAETMQANTFYGDLEGTARDAQEAGTAGGTGPVSIGSLTVTATDGTSTALPNGALMTDYLTVSPKGILQVSIDETGDLYNMINKTQFTQGLSADPLSTKEVRSKLRDEANHSNSAFTAGAIAEGTLSPTYANSVPGGINRAASSSSSGAYLGNPDMGTSEPAWIKPAQKPTKKPFLPDAGSRIRQDTIITEKTVLMNGIPLSTFLRE
jgi:hypothetical protein